ncbi:MAG TPA: hypothetical protein VH682_12265 [Gemmataceae bacterium]|jgi:hypothetical protein
MGKLTLSTGIVALLLVGTGGARAQEDAARVILERAVKAHGGAEALARIKAERIKFKGSLVLRGHSVPFTDESIVQPPKQYRHVVETNDGVDKHTIVQVVNGDKVFIAIDGKAIKADAALLTEIRTGMELRRVQRLLPLLEDKSYQLAVLEEIKVNDRPAVGIRVTGRGRKELRLHFDKEHGLLVRAEFPLDDGKGKQVHQHFFFGDYKDIDGFRRYTKVRVYRDGKQVMEAELLDAKTFDKIDESEFAKP